MTEMIEIINTVFGLCVVVLSWLGEVTGLGYKGVNVVIFCIIWPGWSVWMVIKAVKSKRLQVKSEMQRKKSRELDVASVIAVQVIINELHQQIADLKQKSEITSCGKN